MAAFDDPIAVIPLDDGPPLHSRDCIVVRQTLEGLDAKLRDGLLWGHGATELEALERLADQLEDFARRVRQRAAERWPEGSR
jgi:hypothetical protein